MLSSFVRMVGQQLLPDTLLGMCFLNVFTVGSLDPEVSLRFCLAAPNGSGLHEVAEDLCAETGYGELSFENCEAFEDFKKDAAICFPRSVMESLQDQESSLPVKRRRLQGLKVRSTPFSKGKIQSQKQGIPSNPSFLPFILGIHDFERVLWHYGECQHVKILEKIVSQEICSSFGFACNSRFRALTILCRQP